MIETGRVVLKIAGREAGKYAVVVELVDDSFALITGPKSVTGIKRRKCNIEHIEPTEHLLDIGSKADDASIEDSWKNSGLIEKLAIEVPRKRIKEVKAAAGKQKQ
ncbi:MAG: 50S ribosomal protein L14e [Candidatus Aenigmatarchaeota archaeon]